MNYLSRYGWDYLSPVGQDSQDIISTDPRLYPQPEVRADRNANALEQYMPQGLVEFGHSVKAAQGKPSLFGKALGAIGLDESGRRGQTSWGDAARATMWLPGEMVQGLADSVHNIAGYGGQAYHTSPEAGDRARAAQLTGDVFNVAGALPMAGAGIGRATGQAAIQDNAAGIFGGRLARTADHAKLAQAEDMAAKGAPREQIWKDTGWFKGVDGNWRFEIDDSKATYEGGRRGKLSSIMDHPDLYAAYPEVGRARVFPRSGTGGGFIAGWTGPVTNRIVPHQIEMGARSDPRSAFLHEAEHGVQKQEGFSHGANIKDPNYWENSGEVEARAVEARRNLTPEQRAARPPWADYDTPEKYQVVSGVTRMLAPMAAAGAHAAGVRVAPREPVAPRASNPLVTMPDSPLYSNSKEGSIPGLLVEGGVAHRAPTYEDWSALERASRPPADLDYVGRRAGSWTSGGYTPGGRNDFMSKSDLRPPGQDPHVRGVTLDSTLYSNSKDAVIPGLLRSAQAGEQMQQPGITAYHGSPHSFDKFSMDKIGTGEGAQAYGHGLYFAENEGVAKQYRDALKDGVNTVRAPDGTVVDNASMYGADPASLALNRLREAGDFDVAHRRLKMERDNIASWRKDTSKHDEALAELERLRSEGYQTAANPGHMYEVRINAEPEHFLDWDKPRDQLSPKLQEWAAANHPDVWDKAADGASFYKHLQDKMTPPLPPDPPGTPKGWGFVQRGDEGQPRATQALRDAGIPGIRYLDQGSRTAGEGSRNFVVFDDKLISIVRKYGWAGAAAMLGMSADDLMAQAQAAEQQPVKPDPYREALRMKARAKALGINP